MEQYIPKSALVAEIKRRKELVSDSILLGNDLMIGERNAYFNLLSFIDDLEVKEVDLEKEIDNVWNPHFNLGWDDNSLISINHKSFESVAKHFFELGLVAKDWKKQRMEECPYRQVGCTMYEDKVLECKGACSWVVDYLKLKELKSQKGEEI